jgi:hypothetical protein
MDKKNKQKTQGIKAVPAKSKTVAGERISPKTDPFTIALGVTIITVSILRLRLVGVPLERDEGEYAYIGKLILDGVAPYTSAYSMKLPGTYFMYALLMTLFGKTIAGIHVGLLIMNAATMLFFFLGFRKLFNSSVAFFAASVYGLMALSPAFLGFAAHATHFVSFFVSLGVFFLSMFNDKRNLLHAFLVGIMMGLCFLMKQQAVFFILFGGIVIILIGFLDKPVKFLRIFLQASLYTLGVILPYLLTLLILKMSGAFDKFWFWTVEYASKYASGISLKNGINEFIITFKPMWREFAFFWLLFLAGIVLTFFSKLSAKQKMLSLLFAFFAFLTICPGFYFRKHYFISFLPAVGLLGGISLFYLSSIIQQFLKIRSFTVLPFLVFFFAAFFALSKNKNYYFKAEPDEIVAMVYGYNPFVESIEIAEYIRNNTDEKDKIAVLGSEPQIFFYADRLSATGYIYTYGLMEIHEYTQKMQEEMVAEIEKNDPKYLVFCGISSSWLRQEKSPVIIFDWFDKAARERYVLDGIADLLSDRTVYKWGNEVNSYQLRSNQYILIYKRKT